MNLEQTIMPEIRFIEIKDLPLEYLALGSSDVDYIATSLKRYEQNIFVLTLLSIILLVLSIPMIILLNYIIGFGLILISIGLLINRKINKLVVSTLRSIKNFLNIDEPPDLQVFLRDPSKKNFIESIIRSLIKGDIESQIVLLLPVKTWAISILGDLVIFLGIIVISYALLFLSIYMFLILGAIILYLFLDIMNNIFDIIRIS